MTFRAPVELGSLVTGPGYRGGFKLCYSRKFSSIFVILSGGLVLVKRICVQFASSLQLSSAEQNVNKQSNDVVVRVKVIYKSVILYNFTIYLIVSFILVLFFLCIRRIIVL